jgi:diaminohydroxyphosphoribosylaminopyrimidine deaminase/5-amino-6-(5-phosphoribosylamino)uracil reductase
MERHEAHMRRALDLAERGWGRVSPNPMVGAVVLSADGRVLGEGWHEGPGTRHAEVMALDEAGAASRGATVVCTLEPCDRFGRTPPCTDALIRAGVALVLVAATDPDLEGDAPGLAKLREAGIEVHQGVLEAEARQLNDAFERHVTTGKPFVTLKSGATVDGKTAAADGTSQWITSEQARADAQRLRAWSDAIAVGSRTVLHDDPSLTVRDPRWEAARAPLRVVVDAAGRVPPTMTVFDDAAPTLVATTDRASDARIGAWQDAGADVEVLDRDADGRVALDPLLAALGKRDVQGLLVEGGATLAWSFVREQLVDRVVVYLAPKLLGGAAAPGILGGEGFAPVTAATALEFERVEPLGPDLKVEARVHRDH